MIRTQVGDLSSYTTKYSSPALTQKVFANMRRVGKGFSGVETPLFQGMLVPQQAADAVDDIVVGSVPTDDDVADDVPAADAEPTPPSPPPIQELPFTSQVSPTPPPSPTAQPLSPLQQQQPTIISMDLLKNLLETWGIIVDLDADKDVTLEEVNVEKNVEIEKNAYVKGRLEESQAKVYHIDLEHADKVLSMQDDEPEPTELQEVIE
nr:hypothetical protein [Tanacetum cinerariifolium]